MMDTEAVLFFDTSALVKYLHDEPGSERVITLIEDRRNELWISALARVEMVSALHRKRREQALSEAQLHRSLSGVDSILRIFQIEPLTPSVLDTATQLIRTHGSERALRTLDALHLATFVLRADPEWQFVVADHRLDAVAQEEGVDTIRPSREA
jgi:predicted nucleic acid-binding protein